MSQDREQPRAVVPPITEDSRGILDPLLLAQRVSMQRFPAGEVLDGIVDWFWAVTWDLPPGLMHRQDVVTHPCVNISIGHGQADGAVPAERVEARINGLARERTTRSLAGRGWTIAAKTTSGGFGALTTKPVEALTDRVVPLGDEWDVDEDELAARLGAAADGAARAELLREVIEQHMARMPPERIATAREVSGVAALAERDRSLRRTADLAAVAGVSPRTLQRLFADYVGASPTWILRRYRLIDAAESGRTGSAVLWAEVAQDLGYADQAHLIRDFRAVIGTTPQAYADAQARRRDAPDSSAH